MTDASTSHHHGPTTVIELLYVVVTSRFRVFVEFVVRVAIAIIRLRGEKSVISRVFPGWSWVFGLKDGFKITLAMAEFPKLTRHTASTGHVFSDFSEVRKMLAIRTRSSIRLLSTTARLRKQDDAPKPPQPPKSIDDSKSALEYKRAHKHRPPPLPVMDVPRRSAEEAVTNIYTTPHLQVSSRTRSTNPISLITTYK
jgi:hypothetical protein